MSEAKPILEILVVNHKEGGEEAKLFDPAEITIGRKGDNTLTLPSASVSSRHARIFLDGGKLYIEDLGSTNGTLLKKKRLKGVHLLRPGDEIQIAQFTLFIRRLHIAGGEAPAEEEGTAITDFARFSGKEAGRTERAEEETDALPEGSPPLPNSPEECGISVNILVALILKQIYFASKLTGAEVAERIALPFHNVVEPLLTQLKREKLIDITGGGERFGAKSMIFELTPKGMERVAQLLERNAYSGPAPVSLEAYVERVERQSIRAERNVTKSRVKAAFNELVLSDDVFDKIGPALNSGKAIFLYGHPGNGKTALCQAMVHCYPGGIFIPHAVEVDGNIIVVFDEHNHRPIPIENRAFDQRWVYCSRPFIMVGGELSLDMLDMTYSEQAKFYEAPFQMKANGGILLVDDFGRQRVSPHDLLNRWIVPLESEVDFISLVTGKKIKIPFDVFVAFATNLQPQDLVDDAFLRRVRYKLEVKRPSRETYVKILKKMCQRRGIPFDREGTKFLLGLYKRDNRPMNGCEPRDLLDGIENLAVYLEQPPRLVPELIEKAYEGYFARM